MRVSSMTAIRSAEDTLAPGNENERRSFRIAASHHLVSILASKLDRYLKSAGSSLAVRDSDGAEGATHGDITWSLEATSRLQKDARALFVMSDLLWILSLRCRHAHPDLILQNSMPDTLVSFN